jgi:hypothetical protein
VVGRQFDSEHRNVTNQAIPSHMPQPRTDAQQSLLRRTVELWPYLFIFISVTGLGYIALNAIR